MHTQAGRRIPITSALRRQRQEDGHMLKARLVYIEVFYPS